MMRSEAIAIIKRGLGFRQTQDASIIAALQAAQRDLEAGKSLPNWLLAFDVAIPVTAGTAAITMPTGFLRMHDDYDLYYFDSNTNPVTLPRKLPQEAAAAYPVENPVSGGYPKVFVLQTQTQGYLVPTPTVSFNAYLTYYKAEPVLSTEIENKWLAKAANYIVGLAGMSVAGDLRDGGAAQRFTAMAKLGGQGYMGEIIEQELAGRPLIMGRNN
jgi:hypothetical protein